MATSSQEANDSIQSKPRLLGDIREELLGKDHLTSEERHLVLDQVQALIDSVYVHRPQKDAMYGINAGRQIRLLRRRLPELKGATFHYELLRVLDGLRDMHTTYVLPRAYRKTALLGIVLERCWDGDQPRYLVAKINRDYVDDPRLVRGVEVLHWNGMPIRAAVERNAETEAGGNPAARQACGLESMTLRSIAQSPPPVEDWVDMECRGGDEDERWSIRLPWQVVDEPIESSVPAASSEGRRLGFSRRTETAQQTKAQFFASDPDELPQDGGLTFRTVPTGRLGNKARARIVGKGDQEYGYLRLFAFRTDLTAAEFLRSVRGLLEELPTRGLIIDVRGNGGGFIDAAEGMLQYLTDTRIRPEPMQFISSEATSGLCAQVPDLGQWRRSLLESVETGEQYSAALPLSSAEEVNDVGRVYHGPAILITDALSYSATDMFAAGFQDHGIGSVLGVDDNTGAGGANVWALDDLVATWPDGPFRPLPKDAQLKVALRRSLRVGRQAGRPVEDLGVRPDVLYRMTRDDLMCQNRGLIERAITILEQQRRRGG